MRSNKRKLMGGAAAALAASLLATASPSSAADASVWERALDAALQCVPFAREVSGVSIYGDAHTWWGQAEGRYERGHNPRIGAVMAFTPYGGMRLGHVAVVRRLVNPREVRLDHSNWSLINGKRGQIERDVRAIDVSPANDWSQVRVWFGPIAALGGTAWPVRGFIYPAAGNALARIASSETAERSARDRWASAGRQAVSPILAVLQRPAVVAAPMPARQSASFGRLLAWRAASAIGPQPSKRTDSLVASAARPAVRTAPVSKQAAVVAISSPAAEGPEDLLALVEPMPAARR